MVCRGDMGYTIKEVTKEFFHEQETVFHPVFCESTEERMAILEYLESIGMSYFNSTEKSKCLKDENMIVLFGGVIAQFSLSHIEKDHCMWEWVRASEFSAKCVYVNDLL